MASGSGYGLIITGILVPALLSRYGAAGWRYSWFVLAGLCLLIAVVGYTIIRNGPSEKNLMPIGETGGANADADQPKVSGLQWRLVYKTAAVWHLALIYIAFGFSYVIYATFFARYLVGEAGMSVAAAGRLWSIIGAGSILSGFIWGTLSDWLGRKYALALVYCMQSLCFAIFGLWQAEAGYYTSAALFALTGWSIPAIMAAAVGDHIGARLAPAAFGFVTFIFGIGQVLGPFVAGRIASFSGSYAGAFVLAGGVALAGAAASLLLKAQPPAEAGSDYSRKRPAG